MTRGTIIRRKVYIALRLVLLVCLSLWLAHFINRKNYDYYVNKTLLRIHTDLKTSAHTEGLPRAVATMLAQNQKGSLQELLDRNSNIFALMVTDCQLATDHCPQNILMTTSPNLLVRKLPRADQLIDYPFIVLRLPQSPAPKGEAERPPPIIGRLYTISTIPTSFHEDYHEWLKDPFADYGPWKVYLMTTVNSMVGAVLVWMIVELALKIKWIERQTAVERERILIDNADHYLRQLEEKEARIAEQEERSDSQYQAFIGRIRELETRLRHDREQQLAAEGIIRSIEQEREAQVAKFREQLEQTTRERAALLEEVARYRRASGREKEKASRSLASVLAPPSGNALEREIAEVLESSAKARSGAWLVLHQIDLAIGKEASRFVDSVVISKDCIMVIEAKNYSGRIFAEGNIENTRWHCQARGRAQAEIKGSWGVNPYHQVREYVMALLTVINTRGSWRLPVCGVIVFPGGTDLSDLGDRIGKFYRVTSSDRLLSTLESLDADARRENAHTKRPLPVQIEDLILGRAQGKGTGKLAAR